MDIEKGNIYNLLNGQCQYIIPVYQRKYSWLAESLQLVLGEGYHI